MNPIFSAVTGTVSSSEPMVFDTASCCGSSVLYRLQTNGGPASVIINSNTFVLDSQPIETGDTITAFYNASLPMPLIFPPQYRAAVVIKMNDSEEKAAPQYVLDIFDDQLINQTGTFQLQLNDDTPVLMTNGQPFHGTLPGKVLLAEYDRSTRSIPEIAVPLRVFVICHQTEICRCSQSDM